MADLPPLTPPDVDHAPWLEDEDHTTIRKSVLAKTVKKGMVLLYDPDHAALNFGPAARMQAQSGNIQFGDVEPHFAVVPRDHPALDTRDEMSLFRRNRRIVVIAGWDEPEEGDAPAPAPAPRKPAPRRRRTT